MLINYFIFLTMLFLLSGLALDAGMLQLRRLQLQHAADAAALGAVYQKARGYTDWVTAGKADAALNGFTDGLNGVTIALISPPTVGSYAGKANAVQANVSQTYHTAFMGLIANSGNATPGTVAVAAGSTNPDCVYIMGAGGFLYYPFTLQSLSGFNSACNVYLDSTSNSINNNFFNTLSVTGGKTIKVQGASSGALLFGSTSPSPTFNSSNENDPLAYETAPTFSSCTYTNKVLLLTTATLNPGTYCGGLSISSSTVTFNPGLYIVTGGMLWQAGSTITGTGVTFYLTSGGGYSYANLSILGSTVTLSAPTSGSLTGIVFFVDRNWSNRGSQGIQLNSSYVTTNGIWYALNTGIYNFSSTLRGTAYLGLVVDNISAFGATFTVPAPDFSSLAGGSPFQGSSVGGLVQ